VHAAKAGVIEFRDINSNPTRSPALAPASKTCAAGCMASMPTADSTQAPTALSKYASDAGDRWLGRMLGWPVIRQIARFGYDRFADLLYAWTAARDIGEAAAAMWRGRHGCHARVMIVSSVI